VGWPVMLLLSALLLSANAAVTDPTAYRPVAVQLGLGQRYGLAGIGGCWRFHPRLAAAVGLGSVGVGASGRVYALGPLYGQVGFGPLMVGDGIALYGPDVGLGVDLRRSRFSFTTGLGVGVLGPAYLDMPQPSLDLGFGVNLGPVQESP